MSDLNFVIDMSKINRNLKVFDKKMDAAIMMYLQDRASDLQSYAQSHAPWTDRTTMARQRLKADVKRVRNGYKIELAHGVDYGVWLELAHDKKYAIVKPTIELKSEEVVEGLTELFKRL